MNNTLRHLLHTLLLIIIFTSCGEDKDDNAPDVPTSVDVKRTILVYAINYSSLASDFRDDTQEMLDALTDIDTDQYCLLLYKTEQEHDKCGLYMATKDKASGAPKFQLIQSYHRNFTSTHPDRIKEVVEYAFSLFPESAHDLIFWGHGTSWKPNFSDHTIKGVSRSYGGEYNSSGFTTSWTDIDDLARALPDHEIDTIWFDCCYMSAIEVIYELRNKCQTFVGYPTEVWGSGMPYDKVLPYLMRGNPDIIGGAKAFFDSYNATGNPVAITVTDMTKIENLAECTAKIFQVSNNIALSSGLLNYARYSDIQFYDFREIIRRTLQEEDSESLLRDFDYAYSEAVIYQAISKTDFNRRLWCIENPCGISAHLFTNSDTPEDTYYRTLDWYNRVYSLKK